MMNTFRKLTAPPKLEGDEKIRIAALLNSILLFVLSITLLATPALLFISSAENRLVLFILLVPFIILQAVAYILLRRGFVTVASNIFLGVVGITVFGAYFISPSGSTGALLSITILIAFTTLLLQARAIIVLLAIIILFTLVSTIAQMQGWITPAFAAATSPIAGWVSNSIVFVFTSLGLYLSSVSLRQALNNESASKARLEANNRELTELRDALEVRVQERTAALEKQAGQLQAVSSVARAIASVQDINALLPEITRLVSDQFGFYHVGIFLLDEKRENAILRAANSEGGKRMLERHHQLKLDASSIVGYSISRGEPRVALDVGLDAVYFNNPDLPNTRSEMALPLRIGNNTIGTLDVQSRYANAFSEQDVATISTLADQIAIAIENARLFSESREALKEAEETFTHYVRREWSSFAAQVKNTGYLFDGIRTVPLDAKDKHKKLQSLPQTGRLTLEKDAKELSIPIRLRGQVIGYLDIKPKNDGRKWTQDDMLLLEAAADRAALAIENARLVDTAERRASRERTIGEISTKIGAVSDLDSIMQAAVEELGRKIGGASEVIFELDTEQDKPQV